MVKSVHWFRFYDGTCKHNMYVYINVRTKHVTLRSRVKTFKSYTLTVIKRGTMINEYRRVKIIYDKKHVLTNTYKTSRQVCTRIRLNNAVQRSFRF